jgi:hypothetical protein
MWKLITQQIINRLKEDKQIMDMIHKFERSVKSGAVTSGKASETILNAFYASRS